MKPFTPIAIAKSALSVTALLTTIGINNGEILAQSCLNCWINPQTGQEESLERIIPRKTPSIPPSPSAETESSSPKPETEKAEEEGQKPYNSPPNPSDIPVFDDPFGREESEPQPLPRTQVDPRLRYQEQERQLEENQ